MAQRKSFLLRINQQVLDDLKKWADDDLRSLNGQIEFLLRKALQERGRLRDKQSFGSPASDADDTA